MDPEEIFERRRKRTEAWSDGLLAELRWQKGPGRTLYRRALSRLNAMVVGGTLNAIAQATPAAIKARERQVKACPSSTFYRCDLALYYLKTGDYKRALRQADIHLNLTVGRKKSLVQRIEKKMDEDEDSTEREKEKAEFKELDRDGKLAQIIIDIFDNKIAKATEETDTLARENKDLPEARFLLADLLELQGEPLRAQIWYTDALGTRIKERGLKPDFFTESRNKVYILRWELFPSGTVFMKQYSDRQTLTDEWNNSSVFRQFLRGGVQVPLLNLDEFNKSLLFKAAGEKTLAERMRDVSDSEKMRLLRTAAVMLARIHVFGTNLYKRGLPPDSTVTELHINDVVGQDKDYFTGKIDDTLFRYYAEEPETTISQRLQDKVLSSHAVINARLAGASRDFYKDHNPRNIVVDPLDDITAIDFESSKMLPCQIDLVSLLEFGSMYVTEKQKQAVIDAYINEKERLLETDIDRGEFLWTYQYARVQRHLEMVGYRSRDYRLEEDIPKRNADLKRKQCHLRAAADAIAGLKAHESGSGTSDMLTYLHEGVTEIADRYL
jgi:hypothetical protein